MEIVGGACVFVVVNDGRDKGGEDFKRREPALFEFEKTVSTRLAT